MILQALHRLALREGLVADPDYEPKRIAWLIRVSKDGRLLGFQGTHQEVAPPGPGNRRAISKPKFFSVPVQPQKAGQKAPPGNLVDNALYVFGIDLRDKPFNPTQARDRAIWFREELRIWAEGSEDDGVRAVLHMLERLDRGEQTVQLPEGCKSNDLFTFVYDPDIDQLVTDREMVQAYWRKRRQSIEEATTGKKPKGTGKGKRTEPVDPSTARQCLVTGQNFKLLVNFPQVKGVPGAVPKGAPLVSFNKNAFESLGLKSNENAPISRSASEACATALARLLEPAYPDPRQPGISLPRRNIHLGGDSVVCYWAAETGADDFVDAFSGLVEADPGQVKALYQSVWQGRAPAIDDPSAFYALTLSGAQGRIIVRDWLETSVAETVRRLAQHFADLSIVRLTLPPKEEVLPPQIPLKILLRSLAPHGDGAQVPAYLASQIVRAALTGSPHPLSLLTQTLTRARAEIGKDRDKDPKKRVDALRLCDARAALIKAVLNRRRRFFSQATNYPEVKPEMDPSNKNQGYVLGQLMAVLERLQQEALGDVNASVIDRYFSGASAAPKSVFVRLLRNARHHVKKAQDQAKGGLVFRMERLVDEISDQFDPRNNGFPGHLTLEEQGLFVLGYHQMRKWLWMTKEERTAWEAQHPSSPRAYLWGLKNTESTDQAA